MESDKGDGDDQMVTRGSISDQSSADVGVINERSVPATTNFFFVSHEEGLMRKRPLRCKRVNSLQDQHDHVLRPLAGS